MQIMEGAAQAPGQAPGPTETPMPEEAVEEQLRS
jgi:hypothetical protein